MASYNQRRTVDQAQIEALLQDSDSDDSLGGAQPNAGMDPENFMDDIVNAQSTEFAKGGRSDNRTGVKLTQENIASAKTKEAAAYPKLQGQYIVSSDSSSDDDAEEEVKKIVGDTKTYRDVAAQLGDNKKKEKDPMTAQSALFYAQNMQDRDVRDQFIDRLLNQEDGSSDDDSVDSVDNNATTPGQGGNLLGTAKPTKTQKDLERKKSELLAKADLVTLIENNEKQGEYMPEKLIEQASQLLSFDKEFYNVKKELLLYSQFQQISQSLYEDTNHPYYGVVSCIKLFRAKNGTVVFVGNSSGYIRVFDIQTQKQMKPLYDDALFQNKVTCIDISEDGHYLLAGYKKGTLVLWDSNKYKMARIMKDVAKSDQSEFSQVKILYVSEKDVITIVTAEESGRIRLVHVTKGSFFDRYSHQANSLYEADLKGVATISVQRPSSMAAYYSPYCDQSCLVAYGATNMVSLCEMRQFPPKPLQVIKRPAFCKEKSVPYIDWGYGLTPMNRERTLPLMAIAWDKIIQLMYVDDDQQTILFDGYYCSDQEINQVYFMGDSVLVILVNQEEIKVLYTEKFQPGECKHLELNNEDIIVNNVFKDTIEGTKASELEKGYRVQNIKTGVVSYRPTEQAALAKVMNFNNSISQFKKNIVFVCQNKIMRARLLSWREFIDKLKFTDNQDWLTVLKVSLEIYNGEIKGFAMLPDARERRQNFLKDYMRKLIMQSIQTVIFKYNTRAGSDKSGGSTGLGTDSNEDSGESEKQFSIEEIAIKVSIEFCLSIQEVHYLFTDIYEFFKEKDLRDKFILLLCPAIIAGQFRSEHIPETILLKLVHLYEQRKEFKILEKVIQQLNLSHYTDYGLKPGSISVRQQLEVVCKNYCLVSALLYLFTSDAKDKGGCQQILNMMLKNLEEKRNLERLQEKRGSDSTGPRKITKDDIRLLRNIDKELKYEIEKSHLYIGYKLLWIIRMFLDGKKFPNGDLEEEQWRIHVYHIVDFVTNDDNLKEILDFDPEQFFKIMVKLFVGKPWEYLSNLGRHQFEFQRNPQMPAAVVEASSVPMQILAIFRQASERSTNKQRNLSEACFQELVLKILVGQNQEYDARSNFKARSAREIYQKLELEYDLIYKAMRSAFSDKKTSHDSLARMLGDNDVVDSGSKITIDEQLVIDTLKSTTFKPHHIDEIIRLIHQTNQPLINVKIQLYENKKDYVEAFNQQLNQSSQRKHVFRWLEEKLHQLNDEEADYQSEAQPSGTIAANKSTRQSSATAGHGSCDFLDPEEAKLALADSDDDEMIEDIINQGTKAILEQSEDEEGEEGKAHKDKKPEGWLPYPPLEKLRCVIKERMLDLAKLSTDDTMGLIKQHFDDGEYQEQLIMGEFSKYPEVQLNYLESYVTKNEKDIENTINESVYQHEKQRLTLKYESYLVQFTKLLCQFDKNKVEYWVSKAYFPISQCLDVCRDQENDRGVAILVIRSGNFEQAIREYLKILDKISTQKLLEQIRLIYKDEPNFLHGLDSESQKKTAEQANWRPQRKNQVVLQVIAQFDQILGKAGGICLRDDVERYTSQEGWFLILRYLQDYMIDASKKCSDAVKNTVTQVGNTKYASINDGNKQEYVELLKQFIVARINYILKFPGLDISLEQIISRLNLTFDQIQQLCTSKLKHNYVTMKIETIQHNIIKNNLTDMFADFVDKKSKGCVVEPNKKMLMTMQCYQSAAGRRFKRNTICSKCLNSIVMSIQPVPIVVFQCSHQYHQNCLGGKMVCPLCSKLDFAAIKQEQEERKAANQRKRRRATRRADEGNESESAHEETVSIPTEAEQKEKVIKKSKDLMFRGLEQFDRQLEDGQLNNDNFGEDLVI